MPCLSHDGASYNLGFGGSLPTRSPARHGHPGHKAREPLAQANGSQTLKPAGPFTDRPDRTRHPAGGGGGGGSSVEGIISVCPAARKPY